MYTMIGEMPRHFYVYVDSRFTHKKECSWVRAVWFGLVSIPSRAWGLNVMLECGAIYRNLPPHSVSFTDCPDSEWRIQDAQRWDCYGYGFSTIEYTYLRELKCRTYPENLRGSYLFTAAPVDDGFSRYPDQAKEFLFIQLDNGRLTIQPTNNVVFEDVSFTSDASPNLLKRQVDRYTCE